MINFDYYSIAKQLREFVLVFIKTYLFILPLTLISRLKSSVLPCTLELLSISTADQSTCKQKSFLFFHFILRFDYLLFESHNIITYFSFIRTTFIIVCGHFNHLLFISSVVVDSYLIVLISGFSVLCCPFFLFFKAKQSKANKQTKIIHSNKYGIEYKSEQFGIRTGLIGGCCKFSVSTS